MLVTVAPYTPTYQKLPIERTRSRVATEMKTSSIPGCGLGLYALEDAPAGITLGEYSGDLIHSTLNWMRMRNTDYLAFTEVPSVYIDAMAHPEAMMRYVNHHPDAERVNVRLRVDGTQVFYDTIRPVAAGCEFFTDYGTMYWKLRGISPSIG
jgi:hypothetical protein